MEVIVRYTQGVQFEAEARGHKIISDQPQSNGGADQGMTPPELMLASLGTCAGFYAAQYLKTRALSQAGLEVRVTAEKAFQPARMDQFKIEVMAKAASDPRHREGLMRAVRGCLVHNTMLNRPEIDVVVESPALVGAY